MRPRLAAVGKKASAALGLLAVACAIMGVLDASTTTDVWFFLSTGREICEHGIPLTNPWALDGSNLGIVVQQWAHDVLVWLVYAVAGPHGVMLLNLAMVAVALLALVWCVREFSGRRLTEVEPWMLLSALGTSVAVALSWLSFRPNVWTMACCLVTLSICERTRRDRRLARLFALPLLMVLLMQLHMSMAWLAAFCCGVFALPSSACEVAALSGRDGRRAYVSSHLPFLAACAAMVAAMPLNPYGVDGMLYLFRSFGAASYGNFILEMRGAFADGVGSGLAFVIPRLAAVAVPAAIAVRKGKTRADMLALALAGCVAATLQVRSGWIPALAVAALGGVAVSTTEEPKVPKVAHLVGLATTCAFCVALVVTGGEPIGWDRTPSGMQPLLDCIEEREGTREVPIMCSNMPYYNYMEFAGWKVMVDARPEIWEPAITHDGEHRWREWADAAGATSKTNEETETKLAGYVSMHGISYVIADKGNPQEKGDDFYGSLGWLSPVASTETMTLYKVDPSGTEAVADGR